MKRPYRKHKTSNHRFIIMKIFQRKWTMWCNPGLGNRKRAETPWPLSCGIDNMQNMPSAYLCEKSHWLSRWMHLTTQFSLDWSSVTFCVMRSRGSFLPRSNGLDEGHHWEYGDYSNPGQWNKCFGHWLWLAGWLPGCLPGCLPACLADCSTAWLPASFT